MNIVIYWSQMRWRRDARPAHCVRGDEQQEAAGKRKKSALKGRRMCADIRQGCITPEIVYCIFIFQRILASGVYITYSIFKFPILLAHFVISTIPCFTFNSTGLACDCGRSTHMVISQHSGEHYVDRNETQGGGWKIDDVGLSSSVVSVSCGCINF